MAIEQRLRASLLAQLLAGDEPRCFWTPSGIIANEAFDAQSGARDAVVTAARGVFAGQPPQCIDSAAFRWALTRIVHDGVAGVFACGIASDPPRDRRLIALPEILQFHAGRLPNAANLHRLMDLIVRADSELFIDALLFGAQNGKPFMLLHSLEAPSRGLRSWLRWPLERLFIKRRAAIITNPLTSQRGLAIPFFTPPAERYVVVFPLRSGELAQADRDFLSVLECVAAVVPPPAPQRRVSTHDRIESAPVPLTPRLFYYGRPELRSRIESLISGHGWELSSAHTYTDVVAVASSPFDVMLIDSWAVADTVTMLRWLRHAVPSVPILYFDAESDEETEILVDERIPITSSDDKVFMAIKNIVRQLPARRRDFLDAMVHRLTPSLSSCSSYVQLTRAIARCLIGYFGDWAGVHLFDLEGQLYHEELPSSDQPLMPLVPMTFLNGYAVMKTRLDDEFFAEICEEPAAQFALASMQARSGAAIPLAYGGRLIGSIVVLSMNRDLDEPDFEALAYFAETASLAFGSVQARLQRKQRSHSNWTRVSAGSYDVYAYHPAETKICAFRVAPLDAKTLRIDADNGSGGVLAATLDIEQHTLTFDATHFPPPLYVGGSGPAALLGRTARERAQGTISIAEASVTLVYDTPFAQNTDSASVVEVLQRGLRDGEENPAALLPALSGERFAFIAIAFR